MKYNPEFSQLHRVCVAFVIALVWKWNQGITSRTQQGLQECSLLTRDCTDVTLREPELHLTEALIISESGIISDFCVRDTC